MLATPSAYRSLRGWASSCLLAGLLMWGCATQESPQPPQAPAEVGRRLAALGECVERSKRAAQTAMEVGGSAGSLAPANSGIADAQDAVDDVQRLLRQGKVQEATERVTKGAEECEKIEAMVVKGRQEALERKARAHLAMEAEGRLPAIMACLDDARQAIRRVAATRAKAEELALVRSPLDSAETALKQARAWLAQDNPQQALGRLDTAQADCQTAKETGDNVAAKFSPGKTAAPKVRRQR